MMHPDDLTREELEALSRQADVFIGEVIRQFGANAKLKDFPEAWHLRAAE